MEFPKWTVLIGRKGFDTIPLIPDPTLSSDHGIQRILISRCGSEVSSYDVASDVCLALLGGMFSSNSGGGGSGGNSPVHGKLGLEDCLRAFTEDEAGAYTRPLLSST